jgi:uncharacterized membrane protein YfcA
LIPTALVGTYVGAYLTKIIHDKWFFRWVQIALMLVSIKLLVDGIQGLWF